MPWNRRRKLLVGPGPGPIPGRPICHHPCCPTHRRTQHRRTWPMSACRTHRLRGPDLCPRHPSQSRSFRTRRKSPTWRRHQRCPWSHRSHRDRNRVRSLCSRQRRPCRIDPGIPGRSCCNPQPTDHHQPRAIWRTPGSRKSEPSRNRKTCPTWSRCPHRKPAWTTRRYRNPEQMPYRRRKHPTTSCPQLLYRDRGQSCRSCRTCRRRP